MHVAWTREDRNLFWKESVPCWSLVHEGSYKSWLTGRAKASLCLPTGQRHFLGLPEPPLRGRCVSSSGGWNWYFYQLSITFPPNDFVMETPTLPFKNLDVLSRHGGSKQLKHLGDWGRSNAMSSRRAWIILCILDQPGPPCEILSDTFLLQGTRRVMGRLLDMVISSRLFFNLDLSF